MFDIPVIRLCSGVGTPGEKACWMSALSVLTGDKWTDQLECVDLPIRTLCISINDALPNDEARSRIILPRLFDPLGTAGDPVASKRRMWHLVDCAVRVWAADAMDSCGLAEHARKLRALPRIVDKKTAFAASYAASDASYAASAASYAASDAASDASYAASAASYASDASYAASAASYAASAASYASAASGAARENYIVTRVLPVLDELIEMGPRAKREEFTPKCTRDEFLAKCPVA